MEGKYSYYSYYSACPNEGLEEIVSVFLFIYSLVNGFNPLI